MSIAILYATVSGNAEALAWATAGRLGAAGRRSVVENMADFPAARLREFDTALLIASTWGEGAPPPDAADFCAALQRPEVLLLPGLRYAVFALGSSSYADFCGCGRRLDEDLASCGATRLLPRAESDTKFKAAFEAWLAAVTAVLAATEASA
jgi:sulfite reductase alpha subunit-like flavoprotein